MKTILETIFNKPSYVWRQDLWASMGKSVADSDIAAASARQFITIKKAGCSCHDKIEITEAGIAYLAQNLNLCP